MRRYHRQTILSQIGEAGQKKLLDSKILIIGAGGLGHPAAQYLAAAGVGRIHIVDGDQVQITNLHRQVLFSESDLGKNKAEILAGKIKGSNPGLQVSHLPFDLDKTKALDLIANFDLVLDCTDNFESKFLISDVCALYDKPMVYGAISQFEGQVGVFWASKGACYRCMHPELPKSRIQNCAEAGVVGPVVGILGCMQALEAIKILVSGELEGMALIGKINFYDFLDHSFRSLALPLRPDCPCHREDFDRDRIAEGRRPGCQIGGSALLVDVREPEEWNEFHIEGSQNFALSRILAGEAPAIEKDREIVLICAMGARAERARVILKKMNFTKVQCAEKGVYEYSTR